VSRFSDYLQKTFSFSSTEAEDIIEAMKKPIGKSIRVNTRKIALEDFKLHAKEQGWSLTDTDIPEVFLIDREDTSMALWNTLEHVAGWFYIQEVAAAMPPHLLRREVEILKTKNKKQRKDFVENNSDLSISSLAFGLIIDMCAAPGGKTTQLADYFPESLIIANEVNRTRTPQLFDNLDRMGYDNIAVVSCDGRFFQNYPEFFDAVLLDAPCSGEGTAFRDSSVIDHWNEKNIDRIAKLQKQLFETAEAIVKPGGFLSYSTCTLNVMENEEVLDSRLQTEAPQLTELFRKRFWPHIEHTGGFFASIFEKKSATTETHDYPVLAAQGQKNLIVKPATKGEREIVERFISKYLKTKLKDGFLYLSKDGVYFNQKNLGPLADYFYFVHAGMRIGTIKGNSFTPTHHLFWCLENTENIPALQLSPQQWTAIQNNKKPALEVTDGYYVLSYGRGVVGICSVEKWTLVSKTLL
jgi:16S rRNA (cytosine1407-C5)-methyltransferase